MNTNTIERLPEGIIATTPDLAIKDEYDGKFFNEFLKSLTPAGLALKESSKDWKWVFAGEMTRDEAKEKLVAIGDGWVLPTPNDTSAGAINGIRFEGANLVDNGNDWEKDDTVYLSIRNRAAIVNVFGLGMTTDAPADTKCHVYFVKK